MLLLLASLKQSLSYQYLLLSLHCQYSTVNTTTVNDTYFFLNSHLIFFGIYQNISNSHFSLHVHFLLVNIWINCRRLWQAPRSFLSAPFGSGARVLRVYHYSTRYISLLGCRANRHPHAEQGCPSKLCDIYSQKELPISDFPNPHCIKSYLYRTCRTFLYEIVKVQIYNNQDNVIALYYSC